ncbi:MAG: LssY C-terminal domain-containing protein [Gammaproteobacteria bacterium]|nr:LssY C-terminal domain-containing protein [Gammaproteobacteria bacterium]
MYEPLDPASLRERAESQSDVAIRVSAAVPGHQETESLFGIDLYDQGIQPIWLEIENTGDTPARYAPVGTDPYYFSPLEVAYKNRSGLSDKGRSELERRLDTMAMPRYIEAGETRSGFVYTHAALGAKGFNVDVFGSSGSHNFTFLLRVPGFVPDYANFDAASIYSADQIIKFKGDEVVGALRDLPCCSTDQNKDKAGEPINIVLIGSGSELLRALLRSGWIETSETEAADQERQFLFGRSQDAMFKYESFGGDSNYEIRFWLAPMMSDQNRVWVGQIRHFYSRGGAFPRLDADVDNARDFAIQKFLYGQALRALGWLSGKEVIPADSLWDRLLNTQYFTDGFRIVLWLSAEPYSVSEIDVKNWDPAPGWKQ